MSEKTAVNQGLQPGKIEKFIEDWCRIQGFVGGYMLVVLSLFIAYGSLARYGLRISVPGMIEIPGYTFLISIALATALTLQSGGHIRITFLVDKLKPKLRTGFDIFCQAITLVFCGFLMVAIIDTALAWTRQNNRSADLELPLNVLMFIVAFGFLTLCIQICVEMYKLTKKTKNSALIKE